MEKRLLGALRAVSAAATAFLETTNDRQRLVQTVAKTVAGVVPDLCVVSLCEGGSLTAVAVHDDEAAIRAAYTPFLHRRRKTSALAAAAMTTTVFMPRLDIDEFAKTAPQDAVDAMRTVKARGMMIVPMRLRGELLGLVTVLRHRPELPAFDEIDRELVEHLANHAALALGAGKLAGERQTLLTELDSARFVDAILENIPDMVFVKDAAELRFVRFNRAGEELLGVSSSELLGKNDYDFFPKEEASFFVSKDRETLAGKALVDIPEEPIQTKQGERWLHTKKVPILDADGTPRFLLGISEDITERRKVEAALQAAKDKAESANRELEAFSYSVAHDLRAPLRAIDGFSQALLEDYGSKVDAAGQRHLERIRAASQRMATLIDDLLRLSRISRYEDRRERIDMSAIARIAVAQLERAEPDRKVSITIEDGLFAHADPKLLAIVFDNLFGNAWKFTRNIAQARIELGSQRHAGETIFFVRDNGAGFDMAYQNKLFGVFQRLHPAHEFPGTGIGLATVKRVVERHGGRVWAESTVGKGATFFFTLAEGVGRDAAGLDRSRT